jgi:hypothetical protein
VQAFVIGTDELAERKARVVTSQGIENCIIRLDPQLPTDDARALIRATLSGWKARGFWRRLPYAAVICTPPTIGLAIAAECLHCGIDSIFVDPPLDSNTRAFAQLAVLAPKRVVMVGCRLRFVYCLPAYPWALLDVVSKQPLTDRSLHASDQLVLERLIAEIDLAYSVNGAIKSFHCQGQFPVFTFEIEHDNTASARFDVDWSPRASVDRRVAIPAFDDGAGLRVPHQPRVYLPETDDRGLSHELRHFLDSVRARRKPCNTLNDAAHVVQWARRVAAKLRLRTTAESNGQESNRFGQMGSSG